MQIKREVIPCGKNSFIPNLLIHSSFWNKWSQRVNLTFVVDFRIKLFSWILNETKFNKQGIMNYNILEKISTVYMYIIFSTTNSRLPGPCWRCYIQPGGDGPRPFPDDPYLHTTNTKCSCQAFSHITTYMTDHLHCLRVTALIEFKILPLFFQSTVIFVWDYSWTHLMSGSHSLQGVGHTLSKVYTTPNSGLGHTLSKVQVKHIQGVGHTSKVQATLYPRCKLHLIQA